MGLKEFYQKELDFILEKLRFWRYVILLVVSGIVGLLTTKRVEELYIFLMGAGVLILFFAIQRVDKLTREYKNLLEKLKDTE